MTESQSTLPATAQGTQPQANTQQATGSKGNTAVMILLVILIILITAASIYFWQTMRQQNTIINHLSSQKESQSDRLNNLERSVNNKVNQLEVFAQSTTEKLNSVDRQAIFNTQQLTELGASSRADWLLAEVEYLLHLANQKLNLEKDFAGTEAILLAADKVITELDDPGLLPIREAIGKEVFDIQQVKLIDQEGIYIQLSTLIKSLDDLETDAYLKTKEPVVSEKATFDKAQESSDLTLWNQIWNDLKSVVTIRRLDEPVAPLLAPEQSYYLKQNLRLMLEQASVALLERNQTIFQDSLNKAYSWLNAYFELRNPLIKTLEEKVSQLKNANIDYEIPDISQSLRLTKKKIEAMYRNHSLGKLNSPRDEKILQQESQ